MKNIKDEIKQTNFRSSLEKAIINVLYTSNFYKAKSHEIFKEHNLLQQHFNVLRIVNGRKGKGISPGEILDVMLDKGRDLTRLVDKLVSMDLLTREKNDINKRRIDIHITENGKSTLKKLSNEVDKAFYKNPAITEKEAEKLSNLLDKLRG